MAIKEVGARFSNAEYLKAGFDFTNETGSITITTPEGTAKYEIGGGAANKKIVWHELTLNESEHLDMDATTSDVLTELDGGAVPIAIYNDIWHAITVVSAGQGGNIFALVSTTGRL